MNVSYEGIGQWAATFACDGVTAGHVVKISGSGTVARARQTACLTAWCCLWPGTARPALWPWGAWRPSATVATLPAAGWNTLAADGDGGVSVVSTGGKSYLAVDVDTTAKTVTIVLS